MSQAQILDFLRKNKDNYYTTKDLAKLLGLGTTSVCRSLLKLKRTYHIKRKKPKRFYKDYNSYVYAYREEDE